MWLLAMFAWETKTDSLTDWHPVEGRHQNEAAAIAAGLNLGPAVKKWNPSRLQISIATFHQHLHHQDIYNY